MDVIKIIQGNSTNITINITDNVTKLPIDITGRTLKFIVKHDNDKKATDIDAVINKSQVLNDANSLIGKAIIEITSTETNLPVGSYKFEVATYINTTKETHYQGSIYITESYIKG